MAKCAMYYIGDQKIEVLSTFYGKEKVLLNGVKVSEKLARVRRSHTFAIDKNEYQITPCTSEKSKEGKLFEVRKNGVLLTLVNLWPPSSTQLLVLILLTGCGCLFTFGYLFFKLFWPLIWS